MPPTASVGPVLFARGGDVTRHRFAVLHVGEQDEAPVLETCEGTRVEPVLLATLFGHRARCYEFELPVGEEAAYRFDGVRHPVHTAWEKQPRIAYVSCNGQEHADEAWSDGPRHLMWHRLDEEHAERPFALLLHGGDQLYADEILESHASLAAWSDAEPGTWDRHTFTAEAREAAERFLFELYCEHYTSPGYTRLAAEVPSVMMWDDHDIMDGWGSHPASLLDSEVGRGVYAVSRRLFMLFQLATAPDEGGDAPLGQLVRYPELAVMAPDLRSSRRPERVMDERGWAQVQAHLGDAAGTAHLVLMSSVPLLGPRLSWVEALSPYIPKARRYEDDLRDQWQSREHRAEWIRFLECVETFARDTGARVTVLSGEIHLATRGSMPMKHGAMLHQLVASGVAHPAPPPMFARALGWLASLGEDPLPGQKITLHALPGQRRIYTAERNYLVLRRDPDCGAGWVAEWELEESGRTAPLPLHVA